MKSPTNPVEHMDNINTVLGRVGDVQQMLKEVFEALTEGDGRLDGNAVWPGLAAVAAYVEADIARVHADANALYDVVRDRSEPKAA